MAHNPDLQPANLLTNLTPIQIDGQTVYLAQLNNESFIVTNVENVVKTSSSPPAAASSAAASYMKTSPVQSFLPNLARPGPLISGPKVANGDGNRKLLLPWLIEHLDNNSFEGARWSNRDLGLFLLPWKHGKNRGFQEEKDGEIFKEWAINTGRYKLGDPPQYKVWKATVRNALHKHPHIKEVKEYGKTGLYRVYKIIVDVNAASEVLSIKRVAQAMPMSQPVTMSQPMVMSHSMSQPAILHQTEKPYIMGPPPLTPKTPMSVMSGSMTPATPKTPVGTEPVQKNRSPQDYRTTENSILSPYSTLSSVSSVMSNESEYPSELEMSPGSSVVTTVDVVHYDPNSKQHIRSASGTVLTDIEEVLKQVSLPASMDTNTYQVQAETNENGFTDYDLDLYINNRVGLGDMSRPDVAFPVQEKPTVVDNVDMARSRQASQNDNQFSQQLYQKLEQQQQEQQINQQIQNHQRNLQQQLQQPNQQQQPNMQSLQQQFLHQERLKQQQQKQFHDQQKQHQQQQQKQYEQLQQKQLQQQQQHQQRQQQQNLQMQQKRQNEQMQQQQQQSARDAKTSSNSAQPIIQPNLNHEQHQKMVQLKKLRESLQQPNKDSVMEDAPPTIDDFPIEELLGSAAPASSDKSARRLGKRPRLESTADLSNTSPDKDVDYMTQLKQLGLPKKLSPNSMAITIYYRTTGVAAYGISNPIGARLYYCSNQRIQMTDEKTTNELYGPQDATQICMPWCRESTTRQTLLGTLTRGLILQEEEGDVYATRLCQCAVFFGDKRGVLTKLERGIKVKIFDFKSRFLPQYFQHLRSNSGATTSVLDPLPDADVMLSFGQRWDDKRPIEKTLIWAKVIHMKARQLIIDFTQMFPPPPPISNEDCIQFSESDPYDRLADAFSLAL